MPEMLQKSLPSKSATSKIHIRDESSKIKYAYKLTYFIIIFFNFRVLKLNNKARAFATPS